MNHIRIVDFRARPNTSEYMASYDPNGEQWEYFGYPQPPAVQLADFVKSLDQNHIARALFTGRQRIVGGTLIKGVTNDFVAQCVDAFPDRLTGFAGIDPTTGRAALGEFRRAIEELHLSGLSMDPMTAGILPNDRLFYPLYRLAEELGVPVALTAGPRVGEYGEPKYIDQVAGDFPDLTIIASHGCYPQVTAFIALALRRKNVYLESSIYEFLPGAEPFIDAARTVLQDKIVYASAFPFNPLSIRARFEALGFDSIVLQKLMVDNANKILGLQVR